MEIEKIFDPFDGISTYIFWGVIILSWLLPRLRQWMVREDKPHTENDSIEPR